MRLAAYQFAVCGDIDHNLEIIKKAIVSASENGRKIRGGEHQKRFK